MRLAIGFFCGLSALCHGFYAIPLSHFIPLAIAGALTGIVIALANSRARF